MAHRGPPALGGAGGWGGGCRAVRAPCGIGLRGRSYGGGGGNVKVGEAPEWRVGVFRMGAPQGWGDPKVVGIPSMGVSQGWGHHKGGSIPNMGRSQRWVYPKGRGISRS